MIIWERMNNNFSENVKRLRKENGWSQAKLAQLINAHPNHVNRIETGKYNPSLETITKLAYVFKVSIDYLVHGSDVEAGEIKIEDKSFSEKIILLNTLDDKEREAVTLFIDALLSKKKMINLVNEMSSK